MSVSKKEILIIKYLSGNATSEEASKLMTWLKESVSNQENFDKVEKVWHTSVNLKRDKDTDVNEAWSDFKSLVASESEKTVVKKAKFVWLRVAAAVALFIVTGLVAKVYFTDSASVTPSELSNVIQPTEAPLPVITPDLSPVSSNSTVTKQAIKNRTKGSKKAIVPISNSVAMISISADDSAKIFMLPDNSIVYLNANSKLDYPEDFNRTNRRVSLVGEAYFDIKKDSGQFVVACENTITRGKGTAFNIKSRPQDKEVEVIVASGKVEFSGIGYKDFKKLVIGAGETGKYIKENNSVVKTSFHRKNYKWWQLNGFRERIKRFFEKITGKNSASKNINPLK